MICPECSEGMRCFDSIQHGLIRRRRYRCPSCRSTFTTTEVLCADKDVKSIVDLRNTVSKAIADTKAHAAHLCAELGINGYETLYIAESIRRMK